MAVINSNLCSVAISTPFENWSVQPSKGKCRVKIKLAQKTPQVSANPWTAPNGPGWAPTLKAANNAVFGIIQRAWNFPGLADHTAWSAWGAAQSCKNSKGVTGPLTGFEAWCRYYQQAKTIFNIWDNFVIFGQWDPNDFGFSRPIEPPGINIFGPPIHISVVAHQSAIVDITADPPADFPVGDFGGPAASCSKPGSPGGAGANGCYFIPVHTPQVPEYRRKPYTLGAKVKVKCWYFDSSWDLQGDYTIVTTTIQP